MRTLQSGSFIKVSILSLILASGCNGTGGADSASLAAFDAIGTASGDDYGVLNQCLSSGASVVGFSDTSISVSGKGQLKGSVVLLGKSTLALNGNASVSDWVVTPSASQVSMHGHASAGSVLEKDLTPAESAVLKFADKLDSLSPTVALEGVQDSLTLSGNGKLNVISVGGDIALSGDQTLTLQGGSHDLFLINVDGSVSLSGKASVVVSGGLSPSSVLFRLIRDGGKISVTGNGTVQGTFFAPRGSAQISGNAKIQGSLFAWDSIAITGNGLSFSAAPFCPSQFVPAPAPSPSAAPSSSPSSAPSASPSSSPDPSTSPSPTGSPDPNITPVPGTTASPDPSTSPAPTTSPDPSASASPTPGASPSPCVGLTCGGGILGV